MRNRNNWDIISKRIIEAGSNQVDQSHMAEFLKKSFGLALDALEELVQEGIDLSDRQIVSNLKELELALHQIPQQRVHAFDVSTVLDDFEEYVERFYAILSRPEQTAENSITCSWIVARLDSMAEEMSDDSDGIIIQKFLDNGELNSYLSICKVLCENGSERIKAYVVDAAENVAHALTSIDQKNEARLYWSFVITLLKQDNLRITQRDKRLLLAIDYLKRLDILFVQEISPLELPTVAPDFYDQKNLILDDENFENELADAKSLIVCEVASDGAGDEVFARMLDAADTYGNGCKDIALFMESGKKNVLTPDGSTLIQLLGDKFRIVRQSWGMNLNTDLRYSRAVLIIIQH